MICPSTNCNAAASFTAQAQPRIAGAGKSKKQSLI